MPVVQNTGKIYWVSQKMPHTDYVEILKNVISLLKETKDDLPGYHVFISGEWDSNQSKFEKKSNHAKIGVLAKSKRVGYTLLHFLRMIIDDHPYLALINMEDYATEHDHPMENGFSSITEDQILKVLENAETAYGSIHDGVIEVTLTSPRGKEEIKKKWDEIDLWTFARIEKALFELLDNHSEDAIA
jgi:hypothetical protein